MTVTSIDLACSNARPLLVVSVSASAVDVSVRDLGYLRNTIWVRLPRSGSADRDAEALRRLAEPVRQLCRHGWYVDASRTMPMTDLLAFRSTLPAAVEGQLATLNAGQELAGEPRPEGVTGLTLRMSDEAPIIMVSGTTVSLCDLEEAEAQVHLAETIMPQRPKTSSDTPALARVRRMVPTVNDFTMAGWSVFEFDTQPVLLLTAKAELVRDRLMEWETEHRQSLPPRPTGVSRALRHRRA